MVSGTWEGRGSRKRLGEHMGVGVGVWGLGVEFGVWGFKLLWKLSFAQFLLKTLRSRKQSEALTEAGRKKKQFRRIYLKIVIRGFS